MLVPLSWLKDYVKLDDVTPDELEKKLFSCGFEVEEKNEVGKDIDKVVVGLVEECDPIRKPICIFAGKCREHGSFQVCCGADKVEKGESIPLLWLAPASI